MNRAASTRSPALVWALLHAPLFLALYAPQIAAAAGATPASFRAWVWPTFAVQAVALALLPWLLALPASPWPRVHAAVAPALVAAFAAGVALDAQVSRAVGFHLNGFILEILVQPTGLAEVGLTPVLAAALAAALVTVAALDAFLGFRFVSRRPSPRRVLPLVASLLVLAAAERVYGQVLAHLGGPSLFAAAGVLPLQAPVRMTGILRRVLGREDARQVVAPGVRLPPGLAPSDVRLERRPDVLFVLAESLPHDHLDERTMPHLWRRAAGGARFTRHYAGAATTSWSVFSAIYGLQAHKMERTVGSGLRPLLFDAFRSSGYRVEALAASCVEWMRLREAVFGGLTGSLETWCGKPGLWRDETMVERARAVARAVPRDQPLFLLLFFNATHFGYFRDDRDVAFLPEWDGADAFKTTTVDPAHIRNRARNAARTLDRLLEELLRDVEATRGAAPLVLFTGDHGEEFRQKGHLGHGSDVTDEQVHVPLVLSGPGVPARVVEAPTSHVDLVPTLLTLLGDRHPPSLHSDGVDAFTADPGRFVLVSLGWEPKHAAIGVDLKVRTYAGVPVAEYTRPDDGPLEGGEALAATHAAALLRALRGGG